MSAKALLASVFAFALTGVCTGQSSYIVTDLGSISPTAINTWGQVVGNYNNQAYIYTLGRVRPLGVPNGGTFSNATAINDSGVVAGTVDGPGTVVSPYPDAANQPCGDLVQPVLWRHGQMQELGTLGFQEELSFEWCNFAFYTTALNESGQVLGFAPSYPDLYSWGFLWSNPSTPNNNMPVTFSVSGQNFGLFGASWPPTTPMAISNNGQIVGENGSVAIVGHATSWKDGVGTQLNSLIQGDDSFVGSAANSVNDLGQVVGWAGLNAGSLVYPCVRPDSASCPIHAVLWNTDGTAKDLGTLPGDNFSSAVKINLFGIVVGNSGNSGSRSFSGLGPLQIVGRPFVWTRARGMRNLNQLIPPRSGWVLNSVSDINVWGQIVGSGMHNGKIHGFLLTPRDPFHF